MPKDRAFKNALEEVKNLTQVILVSLSRLNEIKHELESLQRKSSLFLVPSDDDLTRESRGCRKNCLKLGQRQSGE